MTEREFLKVLKAKQGDSTIRVFAAELGISASYLSLIYTEKRLAPEKLLKRFNLTRITTTEIVRRRK